VFPRGGGEIQNTKIEDVPKKIRGGNATGVAPGHFSNLSDITTIDIAMRREYSTSGLLVCGISLIYPLSYASMFRCHMSCPT
jgi:hypothetical protein